MKKFTPTKGVQMKVRPRVDSSFEFDTFRPDWMKSTGTTELFLHFCTNKFLLSICRSGFLQLQVQIRKLDISKTLKKSDHVKPELAVQLTVLELRRKFPDMSPKAANLIWNENDQDISYHNFFPKAVLERVKGSWGQNFSFRSPDLTTFSLAKIEKSHP